MRLGERYGIDVNNKEAFEAERQMVAESGSPGVDGATLIWQVPELASLRDTTFCCKYLMGAKPPPRMDVYKISDAGISDISGMYENVGGRYIMKTANDMQYEIRKVP